MNKEEQIELLEYRILKLKQELPFLCDSDYYNQSDYILQLKEQLKKLKEEDLEGKDND